MEPLVSILCTAYNHEKYIQQCLDGFIMQKTSFPFEVIIHDDASTDRTADIIRQYEKKYPNIIKPIYQTENQYSQNKYITGKIMLPHAKGKYIALCEGDDYWVDSNKLQEQFEALEKNSSCRICLHGIQCVSENNIIQNSKYPHTEIKEGIINSNEFIHLALSYNFQTSCYFFYKKDYHSLFNPIKEFRKCAVVGDIPTLLHLANCGDAYFINKIMSHYRQNSIGSWSQRYEKLSAYEKIKKKQRTAKMFKEYDDFTNYKFHDICYEYQLNQQFDIAILQNNYKQLFSLELRPIMKKHRFKTKLVFWVKAFTPSLWNIFKGKRRIK